MVRGASADALAELTSKAGSTAAAAGADVLALGEQLFSVAEVLRGEPALRRALTDASTDGDARSGLARSIFGASLGEGALGLLTEAVQQRWTISSDLADVLEQLGVQSIVRSAGDDSAKVGDELFAVGELINHSHELRTALSDPSRSAADRSALLSGLLEGKITSATLHLVGRAVSKDARLDTTLGEFQGVAAAMQNERLAVVHTARELSAADLDRLAGALGKQYDSTVHLHVVVDARLVGGLRVEIGDDVIDGSVSSRIDDARRRLAG